MIIRDVSSIRTIGARRFLSLSVEAFQPSTKIRILDPTKEPG